jgi:LPS-assembly protein
MVCRRHVWPIAFFMVLCTVSAPDSSLSLDDGSDLPYYIKADALSYDDATKTYQAAGQVTISRGDASLHADSVSFNKATKEVTASGGVRFFSGFDWLTGSRIVANLETGTGTVYDGTLFIQQSNFYVGGDEIQKTGKDSYYVKEGRFTTCRGDSPDWEITGRDLRVTLEGYGTARHATLRAKSIPVLYAPFLVFPAKTRRQTGLLVPEMGYSNRNGFGYSQPFFWAISESSDATLYENYLADRGIKHGLEYRYFLTPGSKGAVMSDFLWDQKIDAVMGSKDSITDGFEGFGGDDEDRTNRDRWWLRLKSDQELPAGFEAKCDLDLVSDQDYLREFSRGYSGYKDSDDYFFKEFGRGLEDRTETVRLNQLNLNRRWEQYSLNTDIRWYDDVIARKDHDPDPTLQMLPHVQFARSRQGLGGSPLQLDLESAYDYLWRDYGTKGHRADFRPRLYYPVTLFNHFDFDPSFGVGETLWQVEEYENEVPAIERPFRSRTLFDFKADLSTEFSRVFQAEGQSANKIRHAIRPQIVYEYVPVPEDENYPYFEGVDGLEEKHLVTYSVTNSFTAKTAQEHHPGNGPRQDFGKYHYNDSCRIKLAQSYDILEARGGKRSGKKRPFSDITGEVEFQLPGNGDLYADLGWSPYDSEFTSHNALLAFGNDRGDNAFIDYRYTKGETRSIQARLNVKLFGPVSTYCEFERDLKDAQDVETIIGFRYEPQCWSLDIGFAHDRAIGSRECFFEVSLNGLGKAGG